jgi:anti-sigma regulatory factor (Ser/Thr protein kinase)
MHSPPSTVNVASALQGEQFHLHIPSKLEWIDPTVHFLQLRAVECGICDEGRAKKLSLALHEALTNSVVHGNLEVSSTLKELGDDTFARALAERGANPLYCERPVAIAVHYTGDQCTWSLTDQGNGFDVPKVLANLEPTEENLLRPSGRGILMMQAFVDDVCFEAGGRRTVLTLHRPYHSEQRNHTRYLAPKAVRVVPIRPDGSVDWDAAQEGLMRDLSEGGAAIIQKELGRVGRVIIGFDLNGQLIYIPAEIRRWRAPEAGFVEFGCRFTVTPPQEITRSTDETLRAQEAVGEILRQVSEPPVPDNERRRHRRVGYTQRILLSGAAPDDPRVAYARDLSKSGIAFVTSAPVTLEHKTITLPRKNAAPLRVRARVVRCAAITGGFYDVGARFLGVVD